MGPHLLNDENHNCKYYLNGTEVTTDIAAIDFISTPAGETRADSLQWSEECRAEIQLPPNEEIGKMLKALKRVAEELIGKLRE